MYATNVAVCHAWACFGPERPPVLAWRATGCDVVVLAVCLACAWRAERYWVLWATSFAVLPLVTDGVALIPGVTLWANGSAGLVWAYGSVAAAMVGIWQASREGADAPAG